METPVPPRPSRDLLAPLWATLRWALPVLAIITLILALILSLGLVMESLGRQRHERIEGHGYQAARHGIPANANPYTDDVDRLTWLTGWARGMDGGR